MGRVACQHCVGGQGAFKARRKGCASALSVAFARPSTHTGEMRSKRACDTRMHVLWRQGVTKWGAAKLRHCLGSARDEAAMEDLCRLTGRFGSSVVVAARVPLVRCQDWNATWYSSEPELTRCFQHTVLVCLPCVFLWASCPVHLLCLRLRPRRPPLPLSLLCCAKMLLSFTLASMSLLEIFDLLVKKKEEELQQHHAVFLLVRCFTLVCPVRATGPAPPLCET
ncbi:uncharacterized protein LOC133163861 isoform X2 [Syngnathus typhle]|uniref:uncharacterized protein LOC133163861 isoform X2 n=1 Tax=Syngnathus typhle TaxID=161592 RepID=UPI002A6A826B|nr:uncharacterized protein LOC133163861 isoform X2 [Syngnathus typhle]XP_061150116.1 uncharacterized protein LOC133163861 isoform X2 [Syngnathus typhle]XP_061150117.1 uncharacterized protein LOC133163861 isoform X2 [Syngnathus typhle]XP_061150118.1 uncharacterized protein LOC133163861 isoform X2 [Syngnathus typhle]